MVCSYSRRARTSLFDVVGGLSVMPHIRTAVTRGLLEQTLEGRHPYDCALQQGKGVGECSVAPEGRYLFTNARGDRLDSVILAQCWGDEPAESGREESAMADEYDGFDEATLKQMVSGRRWWRREDWLSCTDRCSRDAFSKLLSSYAAGSCRTCCRL